MTKAEHDPTTITAPRPSRRGLLAGSTAALLAGAAFVTAARAAPVASAVATGDDAELLALCAAFDTLESSVHALYYGSEALPEGDVRDEAMDRIQDDQRPLVERIRTIPATTPAGIRAKSQSLVTFAPDLLNPRDATFDEALIASLLADLTRENRT